MRDGDFVAVRILLQHAVVGLDRVGVAASAIVNLGLIVVGISRERIVGIVFDDVAKLGGGEGVFRGHIVAEGGLVELVGRRNSRPGGSGRFCGKRCAC